VNVSKFRASIALVAGLAAVFSVAPAASARADQGWFQFVNSATEPTSLPECMPPELADIVGAQSGTETITGHFSETETGIHVEGSADLIYRVDFPDGRYALGAGFGWFAFNAGPSGQTNSTDVIHEPRTLYDADGNVTGHVMIHYVAHVTYRDANGNGEPDPGEISVSLERFFYTCR